VQPSDSASQHPVDQLIVRLIRDEIDPSSGDLQQIVNRMASAPFNQHPERVHVIRRGMVYGNIVLGRMALPLDMHLAKRVVEEEQWAFGTTSDEYLRDLRSAVLHPEARILVYARANSLVAATISPTDEVVPANRRGVNWLPNLLVVYSARHGNVRTGYMFSALEKLNLPEGFRWLR
jgi:hypothetical protein